MWLPQAMLLKNISQIFLHGLGVADWQTKANCSRGGVIRKRHQGVRSEARTGAPAGAWITPSLLRAFPKPSPVEAKASAAFQTNQAEPSQPSSKKCQTFNLRSHTQFCYREQVVLLACANSSPDPVPPHPRLVEPQAPLHAHHTERKTKTNVFEVD